MFARGCRQQVQSLNVASALLDRLLHHWHIVNIQGNSYRLREYPGLDLPQEVPTNRRRGRPPKPKETGIDNYLTPPE